MISTRVRRVHVGHRPRVPAALMKFISLKVKFVTFYVLTGHAACIRRVSESRANFKLHFEFGHYVGHYAVPQIVL